MNVYTLVTEECRCGLILENGFCPKCNPKEFVKGGGQMDKVSFYKAQVVVQAIEELEKLESKLSNNATITINLKNKDVRECLLKAVKDMKDKKEKELGKI